MIALTRWFWEVVAAGAVVFLLLALLAIDWIAPLDLNQPPGMFTWLHLQMLKVDPERCYAALDRAQVEYKRWSEPTKDGCGFDNGAKLMNSGISHGNNFLMTCHGLAGLILWERGVVAPAAERYFAGSKLTRVNQMGTYSCRNIEHKKDKMRSQHATDELITRITGLARRTKGAVNSGNAPRIAENAFQFLGLILRKLAGPYPSG